LFSAVYWIEIILLCSTAVESNAILMVWAFVCGKRYRLLTFSETQGSGRGLFHHQSQNYDRVTNQEQGGSLESRHASSKDRKSKMLIYVYLRDDGREAVARALR
jgi:hypothetical protein